MAPPRRAARASANSPPSPARGAHALLALASATRSTRNPRERALAHRPHQLERAIASLVNDYARDTARARALEACAAILSRASRRAPFARCARVLVSVAIASCARRRFAAIDGLHRLSQRGFAIARELERFADANGWMAMELDGARGEDARALAAVKRALGGCEREGARATRALAVGKDEDDAEDEDEDAEDDGVDDGDDALRASGSAAARVAREAAAREDDDGRWKRMRIRAPSPTPTPADSDDDIEDVTVTASQGHAMDDAPHVDDADDEVRSGLASPSPTINTQPLTDSESPDFRLTETSPTIKSVVRILMDMDASPRTMCSSE